MGFTEALADWLGKVRYGDEGGSGKEVFAREKVAPFIKDKTADLARSERFASGHEFARNHPKLSDTVQPWVDAARIGWFGDSPEEQSYATYGANVAKTKRLE